MPRGWMKNIASSSDGLVSKTTGFIETIKTSKRRGRELGVSRKKSCGGSSRKGYSHHSSPPRQGLGNHGKNKGRDCKVCSHCNPALSKNMTKSGVIQRECRKVMKLSNHGKYLS